MNRNVATAAARLPSSALVADQGAFFGSILRTLNHLIIADTIWLTRFAGHPAGYGLLAPLLSEPKPDTSADLDQFKDLASYSARRAALDDLICKWVKTIHQSELSQSVRYVNSRGEVANKPFSSLLMHFFNHQTHHRGQATTLLSQQGVDVGVTDLLALVPDAAEA